MSVFSRILKLLRPHYGALVIGLSCLLFSTGAMLLQPVLWKVMVDEVLIKGEKQYFVHVIAAMLVAGMLGSCANGVRTWLLERTAQKFVLELRQRIFTHLQAQPLAFFHERRSGDLISRVVGDVDTVQEVVINGTDTFLSNILGMIGVSAVLIWMNWKLGLATVFPVLVTLSLMRRYNSKVKPVYRAARDKLGDVSAKLQENLTGVNTVKAFAREEETAERFHVTVMNYFAQSLLGISLRARYMPLVQFLTFFGSVIMIGYGGWLFMYEHLPIGTLIAYRGFWWQLYGPVYSIAGINDMLQRANAAGSRIFELLDHTPELRDAPNATELPRILGDVQFDRVSFRDAAHSSAKPPASDTNGTSPLAPKSVGAGTLIELSFRVAPGTRVGLVGPSGAGKSTLLALIPRFYDPQAGVIRIDGVDLRSITQRSLRRQIGMVLQESFLFNESILENIRFGRPHASREEVEAAARQSNAHEFIERLTHGYDTLAGERGVKLSGGQRQRIAIARAFLADPAILLLDEATSAVEAESEAIIQQALDRLMCGRTSFVVSHRLSVIRPCDVILVIDGGRLAEHGTHLELLERGGLYAQMYRLQMGAEEVESARA